MKATEKLSRVPAAPELPPEQGGGDRAGEAVGPQPLTTRRVVGALALGLLGAAANCQPIQPFPGIALALGGLASTYAVITLGPLLAVVAAATAFLPTVFLWEQPFALTVAVSEALVVSHLYCRRRVTLVRSYAAFWSCVGLPMVYGMAFHYVVLPDPTRWILLIKYPVNSLLVVLLANVLLRVRRLAELTGGVVREPEQRLERLLFSAYAPVVVAPLLIFAVSVGTFATNRYLQRQEEALRRVADDIANDLGETLTFMQQAITDAAADIAAQGSDAVPSILEKFHRSYPLFATMLVADASGQVQHSAGTLQGRSIVRSGAAGFGVADREYFRVPMASGRLFVSDGFKGRALGSDLIFAMSAPIRNSEGRSVGVVEASILLQEATGGRQPLVRKWTERNFAVVDGAGRVILASPGSGFRPLENLRLRFGLTAHGPGNVRPELVDSVLRRGYPAEMALRCTAQVPNRSWRVLVDLPLREVLWEAMEGYLIALLWTALAWLLALGVTRVISAQITRPFRYLAEISGMADPRQVAEKLRDPPAGMPIELTELGRDLAVSRRELGRANEELRAALRERDESNGALLQLSADLERQVAARTADLEVARQRAEAASRVKTEFVAHMSHELRTPLNVILGSVRLLERQGGGVHDTQNAARLRQITDSGDLLRNLIEDVLDMAKIESGAIELDPVRLDAGRMVWDCTAMLESAAAAKRVRLVAKVEMSNCSMVTDRRRLQQILINLLQNAIKFTPAGGVVEVSLNPAPAGSDAIRFAVADTGVGMAPEELARIFDPFVRGVAARDSGAPGTGLGLPLVKWIAQHLQGGVEVTSRPGEGSCFAVTLPRFAFAANAEHGRVANPGLARADDDAPAARRTPLVLIAEDHAPNAAILTDLCEQEGWASCVATNGVEAVQMAAERRPDLILMDWKMPLLEGPEATQRIKADPRTAHIPVIALTAYAQPQDAARMSAAGANAYLTKPIDFDRMLKLMGELGILSAASTATK